MSVFSTWSLTAKWVITAISFIGCGLLVISTTDLFSRWPDFETDRWALGMIGSNILLLFNMWLGHFRRVREQQ